IAERDRSLSTSVLAGDVIVLRPGIPSETTLEGDAEVVQIFSPPESLGRAASETLAARLVAPPGDALKRAAIQLFVAVRHDDWRSRAVAEVRLRDRVRDLLAAPADDEIGYMHGGLPPMAISRAERLIAEAMDGPNSSSPTVTELAATAHVSTNHFIRSFRHVLGTTPHQLVMARRCQRAMELLRQRGLTIADVSDEAGYSSPAYFVASFRQQLGVTPGAYQRAVPTKGGFLDTAGGATLINVGLGAVHDPQCRSADSRHDRGKNRRRSVASARPTRHRDALQQSGLDASIARGDLETNSQDLEALLGRPTTSLANVIGEAPRRYT